MSARGILLLLAAVAAPGCTPRSTTPSGALTPGTRATPVASRTGVTTEATLPAGAGGVDLADEEVGPLIARLSEAAGTFPSDNFVSNETSYLDVAEALRDPVLRGRAYVGVGPEQNLTYLALLEPAVAYVVDLRRGNLLEHMVLRACFEVGETRLAFLSALLSRQPRRTQGGDGGDGADFASLAAAFASTPPDRALLAQGLARSRAVLDRLHVTRAPDDDDELARILEAFFARGLSLSFEMRNSGLPFPTLGQILSLRDPTGANGSFLATEEAYRRVRRLVLANRVVPVVGNLAGKHALAAVAADMRARGLLLGAFYASNVEQYLFDEGTYPAFVDNVRAMPRDDASLIVRVWLDPFRPHPLQRRGHRTTSVVAGASALVAREDRRPYESYWEVVTAP